MHDLSRLAQPLIDQPGAPAPDLVHLHRRAARLGRRRRAISGGCVAAILAVVAIGVAGLLPPPTDGRTTTNVVADEGPPDPPPGASGASSTRYRVDATVLENDDHGPQLCSFVHLSLPPQCEGPDIVGWDWADVTGEDSLGDTISGYYRVTGTWDGARLTLTEAPVPGGPVGSSESRDLSTPCPEPSGGWRPVDPATTTDDSLMAAIDGARARADFAGVWVDQRVRTEGEENDPSGLVLNVRVVTSDLGEVERALRELWGGALCVTEATRTHAELRAVQSSVHGADVVESSVDEVSGVVRVTAYVFDAERQRRYDEAYGQGVVVLSGWLEPVE